MKLIYRMLCVLGIHKMEISITVPSEILTAKYVTKICKHCGKPTVSYQPLT